MAVHELPPKRHALARVGKPHVGPDRAAKPLRVGVVAEVVVAIGIRDQVRIGSIRSAIERGAVAKAPDELRGQELLAARVGSARALEHGAEADDVLRELAKHEIGAVAAEHLGLGRRREDALLVGIAEHELPGLDRSPAAVLLRRPSAGARTVLFEALDRWLGEAIGVAEVLAVAGQGAAALLGEKLETSRSLDQPSSERRRSSPILSSALLSMSMR